MDMTHNQQVNGDEQAKAKQQAFFERARKGVLQYLIDKGGQLPMSELHDYSLNKYLIQHQRFSEMMDSFVNEGLVDFDWSNHTAAITEAGRKFSAQ